MIVLLFTGGTISMRRNVASGGAIPALTADEIVAATSGIEAVTGIEIEEWGRFPGPHMTIERMWELRTRIAEHLVRADVRGVVVTHGTDTLEESAYLVARSVASQKPVVFTGAQRTQGELGWDGPANLLESVRVAASREARGYGVMVVVGGQIFSARDVTKANTMLLEAFESRDLGPLGFLDEGEVVMRRELPPGPPVMMPHAPATPVDIIYAAAGVDSRLLDAARERALGVVIAALGRGNVPPEMLPGIVRLVESGRPVVITTRAGGGRVGQTYAYPGGGRTLLEAGAIMGGSRTPQQARIDLMLALGAARSGGALRDVFAA